MKTVLATKKEKNWRDLAGRIKPLVESIRTKGCRRLGHSIAVYFDQNSLQFATAGHTLWGDKLLHVTKTYIPRSFKDDNGLRDFILGEIKNYIDKFGTPTTSYVLGVGGPKTAFRILTLPRMSGKEMAEAVYWEGDKRVPYGLDKAYYGHHVNENVRTTEEDTISASLIAVLKSDIGELLELFSPLKVNISGIHHELEALGHMLRYIENYDPSQTYALINVKKNSSEISFYRGTRLEFMHISSVGSETLSSGPDNSIKYEYFTETLVNEIQNSLDYYVGQFSNTTADTVFVYGDLSYSNELIDNLTDRFGIQFKRYPIEHWLKKQPEIEDLVDQIPVALTTVALAMGSPGLIDFLPPETRLKRKNTAFLRLAVPLMFMVVAVLTGYWGTLKYENYIAGIRLESAQMQTDMFRASPTYSMYNTIKNQMLVNRMVLEKLNQKPTILHLNLKELSRLAPEKVKLNLYDLTNERDTAGIILTGYAESDDPPPEIVLAEFIARLQNSPFFKNVELNRHSKTSKGKNFLIDFQIKMDAVI